MERVDLQGLIKLRLLNKRIVRFVIIAGLILINSTAKSQTVDAYRCQIYRCYLSGNMKGWLQTLKVMERQYAKAKEDILLMEIIRTQYGYIPFAISSNKKDEAAVMLETAFDNLDSYLIRHPNSAEAYAIKSSFYGYSIGINSYKAPFLGLKSNGALEHAMKLDAKNPWVLLEKANALHYIPKIFGGDPEAAIKLYRLAIDGIARNGETDCSWNYLNAYVNLAFCYIKIKHYRDAMHTYELVLAIAPDFKWVKDELIPKLQLKMKK